MKTPKVDAAADAEAMFWEVRVDDSSPDELALANYVRVKIFTEKGKDDFSKHDIPFAKGTRIRDVFARVTKPDGTTVLLNKDDVLEREIVRSSGLKIRAKSFALPGLEVGSIVEYRYKEIIGSAQADDMRLIFQRDIPVENISYFVKPYSGPGQSAMGYYPFNMGNTKFEKDKGGFFRATMTNVPAFREEPSMLPEDEVRSWIYLYYAPELPKADEYWARISKMAYENTKGALKTTDEVKAATAQAIAGASTDDEKLRKIYDFAKSQIKNTTYADKVTDDEKKKVRESKTATDTLRIKLGSAGDVDLLFGAMARAAGFDARLALSGDRSELFLDRTVPNYKLMLGSSCIAVKVGNDWKFYSPASYFVPFGMLGWSEEQQLALITDPKEMIWQKTPLSPSELSMEKRTGKFKLLEDGTLEGEARVEFTGHRAAAHKNFNRGDSAAEQEKTLKNWIRSNILNTAEVVEFTIENVSDPEKPFVYTFKIRVPGYASRTGKRLFFQPNVFERNSKPRFDANARKYDIYIQYPYSEKDDVTLELPPGFTLENAEAPAPIKDAQGIGVHQTDIGVSKDGKTLVYKRNFSFGNGGFIRFGAASYPVVKNLFETFNKADVHQMTLRQTTVADGK